MGLVMANSQAADGQETVLGDGYQLNVLGYGASYHYKKDFTRPNKQFNETNLGLGIEFEKNNWLAGMSFYDDSYHKLAHSYYGGYRITQELTPTIDLAYTLKVGYLKGSNFNNVVAMPTIGIGYKVAHNQKIYAEMTVVPPTGKKVGNLGFWLRYQM